MKRSTPNLHYAFENFPFVDTNDQMGVLPFEPGLKKSSLKSCLAKLGSSLNHGEWSLWSLQICPGKADLPVLNLEMAA